MSAKHIENTKTKTLKKYVNQNIDRKANIISDDFRSYKSLSHYKVNHSAKEYVSNGIFRRNNIENFWSLLKRGYVGIYHYWSRKHPKIHRPRSINFQNIFNKTLIKSDKRLKYKILIDG